MAGTLEGGRKAAETIKKKYGPGFYAELGRKGGKKGRTGGFYDRELAKRAGQKGGRVSRKRKAHEAVASEHETQ